MTPPTPTEREARYNLIKSVLQPGDLILEQRCGGTVMEFICTGEAPGGWRGLPTVTTHEYDSSIPCEEPPYERDDISPMNILYINRTAPESLTFEWCNDAWKARHAQLREANLKIVAENAALWDSIDSAEDDPNAPDPSPEHIEAVGRRPSIIRRAINWLMKTVANEAWASGYHEGRLDYACGMYDSAASHDVEMPF
ncbi:hypothetical protein [Asticcacaulis taihuensis]|uniref:hypothetical protein n=1 Tax=Asticcacaulis taihuensis TaxID=260084 RepID=UPI0026ED3C5E|nr:hypothetical protein [Asticcacaulis taihuensis]